MWFGRKIEFWITLSTNILICKYPNRVHFFVFINKTQTKWEKITGKSTFILHSSKQNSRKANHVYPLYRTFWPLNWKGHASLAPSPTFYLFRQPEDLLLSLTFCQSVLLSKGVHFLFLGAHYWVTNDSIDTQFIRIIVHSPLLFNEINFGRCFEKKSHFLCQNDLHLVKSQSSNNRSCRRFRDRIKWIFFADVCVSKSDRLYICLDYKMFIVVLMS